MIFNMKNCILVPVLLLLFSCDKSDRLFSSRPSGVLGKEAMAEILVDIHLAESALRAGNIQHTLPADSLYQKSQFIEVFTKNRVKPDEFNLSLSYYTGHIDELNEIYTEVINRLTSIEAELEGKDLKSGADSSRNSKKPEINKVP
jgi:hypothetical protein